MTSMRYVKSWLSLMTLVSVTLALAACATTYKAQPLPFRLPSSYPNATVVAGATLGAEAYVDKDQAGNTFGFDVRGAGLLPVQVVFDNKGTHPLVINPGQTFLVDNEGKLWPVLEERFAYERVTKYAQTKKIFSEGAYSGFLGGVAGGLIGAAVGVVSGEDVASAAGKGAAAGAAAGAVLGGAGGAASAGEARDRVMDDFRAKSLQNKSVKPGDIAYGFMFFPGEVMSAKVLRLQLMEKDTNTVHTLEIPLSVGNAK